jgi:hypothetical protein
MPINLIFIKISAAIALLVGAFFWGYHSASVSVHRQWAEEKAQLNAQAAQQIAQANAKVLAAERLANIRIAVITANYEAQLKEQTHEKNRLDAINRGDGLFVNAICPSGGNANGTTATTPSGGDGASRVRLSQADGQFLIEFAAEADQVANQLTQCQAVIQSDREVK